MKRFIGLTALVLALSAFAFALAQDDAQEIPIPAYGCVDLNIASLAELRLIIHIDEVRSELVVKHRERTPFRSVEELDAIHGIGPARLGDIQKQNLACINKGVQ